MKREKSHLELRTAEDIPSKENGRMTLSSPGGEVVDKTLQKILPDKFVDAAAQAAAD